MAGRKKRVRGGILSRLLLLIFGVGIGAFGYWYCAGPRAPSPPKESPTPTPEASATPKPRPSPSPGRSGKVPSPPPDFESVGGAKGVLALVLDDVGYDEGSLGRLSAFRGPIALAVLPDAPHATEAAALARGKGWDLLVHLPMAPESGKAERSSIGPADTDQTIAERVNQALERVPGAVGLNNHQGSKATADPRVVRAMLGVVRDRGLFFLDSRTTAASVAEREARALGISTLVRDVFLDDAATEAASKGGTGEALDAAWGRALDVIRHKGSCILIAHPHRSTLDFLAGRLTTLPASGPRLVKVSELVD